MKSYASKELLKFFLMASLIIKKYANEPYCF